MIVPISIQSGSSSMAQYRTFMCYGDTRTGKTRFAGTFPNAVFLSDASERGWTTLEHMPPEWFYHPGKGPEVLPVSDQAGMIQAMAIAEEWVRKGWIDTVVIDSLTFYAESWYQHEHQKMLQHAGSKGIDNRALYGAMANHLSSTRVQIHKWPCHVVWLALAAAPDELQPGGPMLSGKSRARFPAGCDHIFYHRKYEVPAEGETEGYTVYEAQTKGFGRYIGGGRDGGLIPDVIPWPSFRQVAELLSLPEWDPKYVPDDVKAALRVAPAPAQLPAPTAAPKQQAKPAAKPPTRPR